MAGIRIGKEVVLKTIGDNTLVSSNPTPAAYSVIIIFRIYPVEVLKKIEDWNIIKGFKIAKSITGSYSFRFQKRCKEIENQPYRTVTIKILEQSGMYYFDGYIETIEDIQARMHIDKSKEEDELLLKTMKNNNWSKIVRSIATESKYSWFAPFCHGDILLDSNGNII